MVACLCLPACLEAKAFSEVWVWVSERMNRKKIGSRDYSYVVHLYLQEYNRVYTLSRRSIYHSNRRFVFRGKEKKKQAKEN